MLPKAIHKKSVTSNQSCINKIKRIKEITYRFESLIQKPIHPGMRREEIVGEFLLFRQDLSLLFRPKKDLRCSAQTLHIPQIVSINLWILLQGRRLILQDVQNPLKIDLWHAMPLLYLGQSLVNNGAYPERYKDVHPIPEVLGMKESIGQILNHSIEESLAIGCHQQVGSTSVGSHHRACDKALLHACLLAFLEGIVACPLHGILIAPLEHEPNDPWSHHKTSIDPLIMSCRWRDPSQAAEDKLPDPGRDALASAPSFAWLPAPTPYSRLSLGEREPQQHSAP